MFVRKNHKKIYLRIFFIFILLIIFKISIYPQKPIDYVNPFIGTSNYGACNPGAVVPGGMVSVCPFNVSGEENKLEKDSQWLSNPYVYENTFLTGFSHINLSGVGCPELGSIILMPTTGNPEPDHKQYGTTYKDEIASPGYYSNYLNKYDIKTEMSSTLRSGISRYTFPKGRSNILLNLGIGLTNESGSMIKIVSDSEIEGYKIVGSFCYTQTAVRPVYFVARFSRPADNYGVWKKMPTYGVEAQWTSNSGKYKFYHEYTMEMPGDSIGAYFTYNTYEGETISVKVGISYVSIKNARENLDKEITDFKLEIIKEEAEKLWNNKLSKIIVEGGTKDSRTNFYTALYHIHLHPNIFQDINGEYPEMESYQINKTNGRNRYTTFSLWDTYRNVHPFLSLVYPEIQSDMIKSMLDMYNENGWLPKWELFGRESYVMVGDPATPVICDSWLRGIKNFDISTAYEGMKKAAITEEKDNPIRPGIDYYSRFGFIPENGNRKYVRTVSTSLEYNISDWNLAQIARELGKQEDYEYFLNRSLSYKKYFDSSTGMLRPIMNENADWLDPFNPLQGANFEPVIGYAEGNAWQYRFYVPHDINGLIKLLGGKKIFIRELQKCFDLGYYDMANEPDITYPFLFNYVKGEEWRTQETVSELINKYYKNKPDGLPGNDDTGTLSAWLIYSMMGFYPDCPGNMDYTLFTPSFDKISIQLNPDYYPQSTLVIRTVKTGDNNIYIKKIEIDGKPQKSYFLSHQKLVSSKEIVFYLK